MGSVIRCPSRVLSKSPWQTGAWMGVAWFRVHETPERSGDRRIGRVSTLISSKSGKRYSGVDLARVMIFWIDYIK